MFNANFVPGQGFQPFFIYEKVGGTTSTGRPTTAEYVKTDRKLYGILAEATQQEIADWKQNQHPITHVIVQYGAMAKAQPTDYLVLHDGRKYYVQGADNAGDLNVAMIYYVEKRFDLK